MVYFNLTEFIRRVVKYLIEGFIVSLAAFAIPKQTLNIDEILLIALVAAMTFSILDVFIPSMGASARNGAGLGIGLNLVGFPATM
jgi:ABC-type Co2+ transport system permease subunit